MINSLGEELKKGGLTVKEVLAMDPEWRIEKYKEWSKALGVTAMERQDLYGFLQFLLMRLGKREE